MVSRRAVVPRPRVRVRVRLFAMPVPRLESKVVFRERPVALFVHLLFRAWSETPTFTTLQVHDQALHIAVSTRRSRALGEGEY